MGIRAADKFINSILDTVNLLALNPNMGQPIELNTETCKRNYRSFVEHKNHKIIYYVFLAGRFHLIVKGFSMKQQLFASLPVYNKQDRPPTT